MKKFNQFFICSILILSQLFSLTGCKKRSIVAQINSACYSFSIFEIPIKEEYSPQLQDIFVDGNNTCISVVYSKFDKNHELADQITDVFTINADGKLLYTLELIGCQSPCIALGNEYVYLGTRKSDFARQSISSELPRDIVFLDKTTGNPTRVIETDFQPYYLASISDGFVIVGLTTIARYNLEGILLSTIKPGFSCYVEKNGFFEDCGHFYVLEERNLGDLVYHEVNFETCSCSPLAQSTDMGIISPDVEGQYFFNPDGEYKVNLLAMQTECLADLNYIDIRPPLRALATPCQKYCLDDERFAISYEYRDKTAEVLLFQYDSSIVLSHHQIIRIGGYGVFDDPILQWARYNFNISNNGFRVVLEDYGERFEGYSPEERRRAIINLSQYFKEGNAPDIFFGTRFDYAYMGHIGMVIDMSKYIGSGNDRNYTLTNAAYNLLFDQNGACYQVFSSYVTYGYYAPKKIVDSVDNPSVKNLCKYAEENNIAYSDTAAADIVDEAIRYISPDLFGAYDGKQKYSHEELSDLLSCVLSLPVSQGSNFNENDVISGNCIMCSSVGYCYISSAKSADNPLQYIGYPSIHGSIHLAVPQCCLAISSSAKDKSACWNVLESIFSEEAQKQSILSGYIPISQTSIDSFCEIALHPDKSNDSILGSCVLSDYNITQEDVDRFLFEISEVDTLATYDWGIFDIIQEEINSYYSQKRSPDQIASSLEDRLKLYMQENYQ